MPDVPLVPVKPDVPEEPVPPEAPAKLTLHEEYVPLPLVVNTFTDKAPVPLLYEITGPVMSLPTLFAIIALCPTV
jgi:hypothetical protein